MAFDDPALLAEFVTESRDHLADVEGQLLDIEAAGEDIDVDLVNRVFRGIHSIKGAAGFMGLSTLSGLAHSLENVLGKIRNCELVPTSAIVDTMLKAADTLTGLVNDIEISNDADVSVHVAALDAILAGGDAPEAPATSDDAGPEQSADKEEAATTPDAPAEPLPAEEPPTPAPTPPPVAPVAEKKAAPVPPIPVESSIRVQVGVLDSLMNLAGELVLGRNQLLQTINAGDNTGVQTVATRLDQVTSELQEAIMQTRMQPIGNVFGKFPRVIRDLSAKLGKQCSLVVDGKEVEVDKTIIEAIGDPLTHLVRNSIDHGIEKPDVRMAAGKKAEGTINLRAYHQAGKVRIDIIDDGGGINPAKLKQKAIEKGVITADRADQMSDRDAVRLIFHPGFSTAEKLSDVSGRGVGMDVVRTNIERLGGTVDVESEVGSGSSIQITLPLTLAIIPSMIVRSAGERYAIPQVNIVELVRIRASEVGKRISQVKGARVLRLRGTLLPLVELSEALHIKVDEPTNIQNEPCHVIVVETGQTRYGLIVDELDDSEEIVVKPLGRHLKSCSALAGATILGDGHVAPILDIAGIAAGCDLQISSEDEAEDATNLENNGEGDKQSLVLFENAPGEQFAVPMSLISRIERIKAEQLDSVGGREVLQYRHASLPLLTIEKYITAKPRQECAMIYVVVFMVHGREVGLLAPQLNDIREICAELDGVTFREPGVAGSFVIDEQATRLLDLYELAQKANPEWFVDKPKADVKDDRQRRILLAEDSTFFRRQVKQYLESEGFEIVDREDGQEAWEVLEAGEKVIDLVITDIEMPRMDGFQFSRQIKSDPRFSHLPIIALTSLASDSDRQKGLQAGIDEYQVKLDREHVMEAIWRLLKAKPTAAGSIGNNKTKVAQGV